MEQFQPNKNQLILLETMLDPSVPVTISDICAVAGINRSTYYRWMKDKDFLKWFRRAWKGSVGRFEPILDKIALYKAKEDFRYYKLLQDKYFMNDVSSYEQSFMSSPGIDNFPELSDEEWERITKLLEKYEKNDGLKGFYEEEKLKNKTNEDG